MIVRWGILLAFLLVPAPGWSQGFPADWPAELITASRIDDPGNRVVALSAHFLGTPYVAHTLGGGADLPERLVIRFDAVDCFTLLDYLEASRRSATAEEFRDRLIEVRYRDNVVAWDHRRHFFSDWVTAPEGRVVDVTAGIGGDRVQRVVKQLNVDSTGRLLLAGVPPQERTIAFIPTAAIDPPMLEHLQPGDYLGIYTPAAGLDVTHVGLLVRHDGRLWLRHASSRAGRVIDSDLREYLAGKPGVIVLRPR